MNTEEQRDPTREPSTEQPAPAELRPSPAVARRIELMSSDLGEVLSAAERAARRITADARHRAELRIAAAERDADRLGAERARRLAELTDGLAEQVDLVRRRSSDLMSSLERQTREVEEAYATMVESLVTVSAAILERARPREIDKVSISQRREVSLTIPGPAGSEAIDMGEGAAEADRE